MPPKLDGSRTPLSTDPATCPPTQIGSGRPTWATTNRYALTSLRLTLSELMKAVAQVAHGLLNGIDIIPQLVDIARKRGSAYVIAEIAQRAL
jgi:hypothetical protein